MKNIVFFFAFFFLGVGAVVLYKIQIDAAAAKKEEQKIEIPTKFSLEKAPSAALYGLITSLSGNVGWESRVATEPARITVPQKIGQGEALETKEGGRVTVAFPNIGTVTLLPKTYVGIIQTLPVQVVLAQTKGDAIYRKEGAIPLSVTANNLLVKINSGQVSIAIDDTLPLITGDIAAGASATLAYVDTNDQSTVATVENGEGFTFNTRTKRLRIVP